MDTITILAIFCLISAITTYGLGIFVYAKNPQNKVNRLFLFVSIGASYWAVGEFLIWNVNSYENVFFWLKVSSFWTIVIVLCIHFVLAFADHPITKQDHRIQLILILYLPALIIACINILTDHIFIVTHSPERRYYYVPAIGNPIYTCATIYFLAILFWAVYIGIKARNSAGTDKLKRQSSSVSIGLLVLIGFGSQSVIILPLVGIYAPNLVFIGIVLFSGAITYAILKYGLFVLSPETVATNIIQTMPDGLILTDMDGRIVTTNQPAQQLCAGYIHENNNANLRAFLPEPLFFTIREKIIQEGVISDYELIPDDDTKLTISLSGSLIRAPDGIPAGLILILHDITQRKNAEKALKKAHEKISLLTHLTRHDISNLIMVVSGYLELLKEEQNTEKREQMLTTCQEMTRKIMRHLHFSREYQSIGLHEPVWQDCDRLVKQAIDDLHLKGVNLHINLIPADIYADPLSVKVIYNILENALRHATGLTHIEISSHTLDDGSLLFMVKDNGTGIKPEEKEKIFTQGYGKNTGLGLTLAREILMVTNITINETGTYGKGAQFEIHIPPLSWRPKGITHN